MCAQDPCICSTRHICLQGIGFAWQRASREYSHNPLNLHVASLVCISGKMSDNDRLIINFLCPLYAKCIDALNRTSEPAHHNYTEQEGYSRSQLKCHTTKNATFRIRQRHRKSNIIKSPLIIFVRYWKYRSIGNM